MESRLDMGGVASTYEHGIHVRVSIKRDLFMYQTDYDGMHRYPGIVSVWETNSEN